MILDDLANVEPLLRATGTHELDASLPVAEVVAAASKDAGAPITLRAFERFQLGEGIAKAENDFAAEVAAASGVPQPVA